MPNDPTLDATIAQEPAAARTFASGRYVVLRTLGGGTQKVVYLVHDRELERQCALSLILAEGAPSEEDVARFRREARAMARLGAHPNIVTVHDLGLEGGHPYVVCEYVSGGDLREELRRAHGPLALARALSVAADLLRALEFSHTQGIVHRDIKPANIWIAGTGTAKVGDFGMASAVDWSRITTAGAIVGTPSYMAPEQARGEGATPASDLYAVGCVLHEMLTGTPPFQGEDVMGVLYQHVHVPPPPIANPDVPRAIEKLVRRLLAKDRAERPETAHAARLELESAGTTQQSMLPIASVGPSLLVGRRAELETLLAALNGALSGRGGCRFVVGEGGIGKTRLCREVVAEATRRGMRVLVGSCSEAEGATPYLPWGEALAPLVEEPGDVVSATDRSLLGRLLPGQRPAGVDALSAAGSDRHATFQAVSAALASVSARSGLLILLEDLHWADKPSLLLLVHLARQLAGSRTLVLGTYRDTDVDRKHPLAEALVELRRDRLSERVLLRGLSDDDARELVRSLGGASDTLVDEILKETEGHPFFIEELLRHVVETGAAKVTELGLPEGIREVIGRRLSRLSPECNRLLSLAATAGNAFGWSLVALASGDDEDRLLDLLDEALAAHVIRERRDASGTYEFAHALIRQTLREELSVPRRARLHRTIGEAMEKIHGAATGAPRAEIVHHFIQAGTEADVARAVPHALAAAEVAMRMLATEDAVQLLEGVRQALDTPTASRKDVGEILVALGSARLELGDLARGQADCSEAAVIGAEMGDPDLRARAALAHALRFTFGVVLPRNVQLLEEALAALPPGDSSIRARVMARLGAAKQPCADYMEPVRLATEAIAMARRLGDSRTLLSVLHMGISALMDMTSVAVRRPLNLELLDLASRLGDRATVLRAHGRLFFDCLQSVDVAGADEHLAAYEALALGSRNASWEWYARMLRAARLFMQGRQTEGAAAAREALAIAGTIDDRNAPRAEAVQRAFVLAAEHRWDESLTAAGRIADYNSTEWAHIIPAYIAARGGRIDVARGHVDKVLHFVNLTTMDQENMLIVAQIWIAQGHLEPLPEMYEKTLPLAGQFMVWGATGMFVDSPLDRMLGNVAAAIGRDSDADRHYEAALAIATRAGMPLVTASMQLEWGRHVARRNGADVIPRARALIGQARETGTKMGVPGLVADADRALRDAV